MSFGLGNFCASAGADEIHCVDRGKCWLPSSTWVYDWLPSGDQTWQWKILCLCYFPLPRFITRGYHIHNWTLTSQIREIRCQPASKPDSVDLRRHFLVNEIRRNRSSPGGLGGLGDQKETKMWNTRSCHLMSTMFNLNKYIKQYQTYHYNSAFFFWCFGPKSPLSSVWRHPTIEKLLLSFGAKPGSKLPEPPGMNTYGALGRLGERHDNRNGIFVFLNYLDLWSFFVFLN